MPQFLTFQDVSFNYESLAENLIIGLTVRFPTGWTGVVGPNGSGKTTLLRLAAGELTHQQGQIHRPGPVVYCPQRTDDPPEKLADFLASGDTLARELRGRLNVAEDYFPRWGTLSHGERKRAQIAVALWQSPSVLAIDEPSNHIDSAARDLLTQRLADYDGVGLLVSHDRDMLDRLCSGCLFMDPPTAVLRPGNYTTAFEQQKIDLQHLRDLRQEAGRQVQRLRREMVQRRQTASKEHKIRSKRGLSAKDHDAKEKIDRARVTDSNAGASLRQLQGRMDQAMDKLASLVIRKEAETGIFLPDCRSKRDYLFRIAGGSISLFEAENLRPQPSRILEFPEIFMRPADRVALTGDNGTGKSTFIRHIIRNVSLPSDKLLYMPQEISAEESAEILKEARNLKPDQLGWVMNIISRLGSTPQRLLESELPSPGETRKLMLALGISRQAHLIIMDEPTNHLDLPSIQCLEEALSECPCGLLLVSHDIAFLKKLSHLRWTIRQDSQVELRSRLLVSSGWA